jgi:hypothetical protein
MIILIKVYKKLENILTWKRQWHKDCEMYYIKDYSKTETEYKLLKYKILLDAP